MIKNKMATDINNIIMEITINQTILDKTICIRVQSIIKMEALFKMIRKVVNLIMDKNPIRIIKIIMNTMKTNKTIITIIKVLIINKIKIILMKINLFMKHSKY